MATGKKETHKERKGGYDVVVSHGMTGKMEGIDSISTSCILNTFCEARKKDPDSVCSHCYATRLLAFREGANRCYERNLCTLRNLLPKWKAARAVFTTRLGRFEAFGDLSSVTHARNYLRIARANPDTRFAIWTKNWNLLATAIKEEGGKCPRNLSIVLSSNKLNGSFTEEQLERIQAKMHVDHVFEVYTPEYLKEHPEVKIECGGRKCLECGRCYRKTKSIDFVREQLK